MENYNKHIDFYSIFKELMDGNWEIMEQHNYGADHYRPILDFYHSDLYKEYSLDIHECDFTDSHIWFSFFKEYDDANESDTQNSYSSHLMKWDRVLEEFTQYEYDQG